MTFKMKTRHFFKRMMINMIRNQEHRAAQEMARFLIKENRDFQGMSEVSLTKAIASKKMIKMDQIPAL